MIEVIFKCDGCNAEARGKAPIRRWFNSFTGHGYGFGRYLTTRVEDASPQGWVPFDPYTNCCYCPSCWQSIIDKDSKCA